MNRLTMLNTLMAFLVCLLGAAPAWSQDGFSNELHESERVGFDSRSDLDFLIRRLNRQEKELRELRTRLDGIEPEAESTTPATSISMKDYDHRETEKDIEIQSRLSSLENLFNERNQNRKWETTFSNQPDGKTSIHPYYSDYDGGFMIRPTDKCQTPFELKINARMQFHYSGFQSDRDNYTNQAGNTPQQDFSEFEIERARLEFSGFMYNPNLQYYINMDSDTDDNHSTIFHDFWMNYKFSDRLNVFWGKAFVPGSRAWIDGSTRTHLAARSVSTSFFRPDRSLGVWAIGELSNGTHYRAMVSNGFNTTDLERSGGNGYEHDEHFFYSATTWWEPLGTFGKGYADLEHHCRPVIRFGQTFIYGEQDPQDTGAITREQREIRLSDGSRLTDVGVNEYDLYQYALDFAMKYNGWSVNSEYYFRWINDIRSGGAFGHQNLYQDGFYADVGYMVLKKKLELVGRVSLVDGMFHDAWEYAGGVNWYINGTHKNKLTFDVAKFNGVPTSTSGADLQIGMDGMLYRMQYQLAF
jgi:hypothetical protein